MAPRPPEKDIQRHLRALPLVESGEDLLNDKATQHAVQDLEKHGSIIPKLARQQGAEAVKHALPDLEVTEDGDVIVSVDNLQAIATNAALRGSGQTAYSLGHVILEAEDMQEHFDLPPAERPELPPAEAL